MTRSPSRRTAARVLLTRERVVEVAIGLADAGGLQSLTMRRLGQAVNVEAMSLYNHVTDKDELLNAMADAVLAAIDRSPASDDWLTAMRASAISAHDVLLAHPWACELLLSTSTVRIIPARIDYMESILARLRDAGFSPAAAYHGYHSIDSHVLGFTVWELGHALPKDAPPDFLESVVRELDLTRHPYIAEHAHQHLVGLDDAWDSEFEFGLDLILDALQRIEGAPSPG